MCDQRSFGAETKYDPPAVQLARLCEEELGYDRGHIDSVALRLLIQARWEQIIQLAHAIHKENPK